MKTIALVAFLALSACAGHDDRFRHYGFDDAQLEAVQDAADAWCGATGGARCPRLTDRGPNVIQSAPADSTYLGTYERFSSDQALIRLYGLTDLNQVRLVAMHEFGHYLGCEHNEESIVMGHREGEPYPSGTDLDCVDY